VPWNHTSANINEITMQVKAVKCFMFSCGKRRVHVYSPKIIAIPT
jgi:hypothetical protein